MSNTILMLHPKDNVVVALKQLKEGDRVKAEGAKEFAVLDEIAKSHKIALIDIAKGKEIIKYGEAIAVSSMDIKKGQWVHTHNIETGSKKNG
jgi:altronate hydrolase